MQKTIGERIKAAREAKGMSQEDLGKSFGATKQTIYKYETGIITNIPLDNLEKMASVLGVSSAYLAGWEDTPEFKSLCKVAEDMYKKEAIEKFVESFSADELEIVSILRKMSPEQLARELAYLRQASADGQGK